MATELVTVLEQHRLWRRGEGGARANLAGADLTGANLAGAYLAGADLARADLAGAYLAGANLARADLAGANLARADLTGANLARADLAGAYLAGADLTGADLTGANLTGANLTDADLTYADLTGAYLTGADLTEANLTEANLTRAYGITWAQIGPVGQGCRLLTAWAHLSLPEPVIGGGCYRGTFDYFRAKVSDVVVLPWDWAQGTAADVAKWRRECLDGADLLALALEGQS
jgi:hypothetical protein